jgi:hypothetical protein
VTANPKALARLAFLCLPLIALAAGCSRDENVRGAGSIDVPKPEGMMTAEEAAAITGSGESSPSQAP